MRSRAVVALAIFVVGALLLYFGRPGGALLIVVSPVVLLPFTRWIGSLVRLISGNPSRRTHTTDDTIRASFTREAPVMYPEPVDHTERVFGSIDIRGSASSGPDRASSTSTWQ